MYLDRLNNPSDLKGLSVSELKVVAQEIRDVIIGTVSENGGHLASSLGVVELTIALLSCFDLPQDKIVWDVGHQCYPYKILTGRRDRFSTLRRGGGISGFPCRTESCYDVFGVGHASTSIGAALGFAKARDLRKEDHKVVAVIGDGALTGGIAWEAINNAGAAGTDMLVVLNDNKMSISPNVGALAKYISQLRSEPIYQDVEGRAKRFVRRLTGNGLIYRAGEAIQRGITHWVSPGNGTLFESMGFTYLGPVDGHDIRLLKDLFRRAKRLKGPVLVHVMTTKGKGTEYAEKNARAYHGVGKFDAANGQLGGSKSLSFSDVFGYSLIEFAERKPELIAITAAMPDGTGLAKFAERYPDRFFDVGIAEEHAVVFAAGLASGGMKPVVAIYSTFLQRAYDQVIHDVCLQNLPVVFAIDRAGIVGQDGATHQGVFDLAYLRHIPNLVVMAPHSGDELRSMLQFALTSGRPCAIRYPRDGKVGQISSQMKRIEMGRAEVLCEGTDVALLAIGNVVERCLEARAALEEKGLSVSVVNCRFVKPLDERVVADAAAHSRAVVTVEENVRQGGFGSAVLEFLNERRMRTDHVLTIGLPDEFIMHDNSENLRHRYGCSASVIADRTAEFLNGNHRRRTSLGRPKTMRLGRRDRTSI